MINSAPSPWSSGRRAWLIHVLVAAALGLAAFTAFQPVLEQGFLDSWDDSVNFLHNPDFGPLSPATWSWAWTTRHLGVYQPLGWLLFAAETSIWGVNGADYHLVSLALHGLDAFLVWLLVRVLMDRGGAAVSRTQRDTAAFVAALLYTIHPMRAEVVAWASCQPYLLSAMFSLMAVLAYARFHPPGAPRSARWLLVVLPFYTCAVLAKAPAITLPAVLVVLDVYPLRRVSGDGWRAWGWGLARAAIDKAPLFAVTGAAAAAGIWARHDAGPPGFLSVGNAFERLPELGFVTFFYPLKTLAPWHLAGYYPALDPSGSCSPRVLAEVAASLAAGVLALRRRRRTPGLLAALTAYVIVLLPNAGIVWQAQELVANRYGYMALMPLTVATAGAGAWLMQALGLGAAAGRPVAAPFRRQLPRAAALTAFVVTASACLIAQSRRLSTTWHDATTFWERAQSAYETDLWTPRPNANASSIYLGLGQAQLAAHALDRAEQYYRQAIALSPQAPKARLDLGVLLLSAERLDDASAELAELIARYPDYAKAHYNLGVVREHQGRFDEAAKAFADAVRIEPRSMTARLALARMLATTGRLREAVTYYDELARQSPGNPQVQQEGAAVRAALGPGH